MMSSQNHLAALPLELHAQIFSNLQPYDILQVLQTCKALYLASWQRTVWTDALHRICVENTLFEPSFPVESMSVLELQHASMGPHLWIARSSSKERNPNGVLPHPVRQHPMSAMDNVFNADLEPSYALYLVPGGRYLFSSSRNWLVLLDLGSPYSSGRKSNCIQVAAVPAKSCCRYLVHSTPDGMGLRVFLGTPDNYRLRSNSWIVALSIYEIYPESTSPQLRQIACTCIPNLHSDTFYSLSHDHLIFACRNIITVWNFKTNTWARWSIEGEYRRILTTKSAVMLIRSYGVSVWEIPPLLPKSSLSMSTNPSVMSPAFELHYPKNYPYQEHHHALSGWYSGTSQPIYYDVEQHPGGSSPPKINRFEVTINSKISGGTLNLLNTFKVPMLQYCHSTKEARICQDTNVKICTNYNTGCLAAHVTDIYDQDQQLSSFVTPFSYYYAYYSDSTFCPPTGRVVYCERNHGSPNINVLDLNHFKDNTV